MENQATETVSRMDLRILPTASETRFAIETLVANSDSVKSAVAFVRKSGVEKLGLVSRSFKKLQVLADTDFGLTQVDALEALHAPPDRTCKLFLAQNDEEGVFDNFLHLNASPSKFDWVRRES